MTITRLKTTQVAGVLSQVMKKQGGKCAICGHPFTQRDVPVLDHCHTKGYIRGALHNSCNGIEGRVKKLAQRGHTGISAEKYVIGLGKYLDEHMTPKYNYIHPSHKTEDEKRLARNKKARAVRAKKKV
jgi:hypothetical protein|tara:strand:- start:2180 stop:2563 length:384 start_codon:yes stop_codon:yes gene_type:complete